MAKKIIYYIFVSIIAIGVGFIAFFVQTSSSIQEETRKNSENENYSELSRNHAWYVDKEENLILDQDGISLHFFYSINTYATSIKNENNEEVNVEYLGLQHLILIKALDSSTITNGELDKNESSLTFIGEDDNQYKFNLYSSIDGTVTDYASYFNSYNYTGIVINEDKVPFVVKEIRFTDHDGNLITTFNSLNLSFDSEFKNDSSNLINTYNNYVNQNALGQINKTEMKTIQKEINNLIDDFVSIANEKGYSQGYQLKDFLFKPKNIIVISAWFLGFLAGGICLGVFVIFKKHNYGKRISYNEPIKNINGVKDENGLMKTAGKFTPYNPYDGPVELKPYEEKKDKE